MPRAPSLEVGKFKVLHTHTSRLLWLTCCLLLFMIVGSRTVSAVSIGQEFIGLENFERGSIVSLDSQNPDDIVLASLANSVYQVGVVVGSTENSVTFSKNDSSVAVALSGDVQVYVSDVNGVIKQGDSVSASWLEGVGMKARESEGTKLLGVALEDMNLETATMYGDIETPDGQKTIKVGVIKVKLFNENSPFPGEEASEGIQGVLERIAGKRISYARVLAGSMIFIVSLLVASVFIATSIRGSFISIGRNPLASLSIYKNLWRVSSLSILVILVGTALSYVILVV